MMIRQSPLHETAGSGQKELVELLLSKGVILNVAYKEGKTPVDLAEEKGFT